MIHLVYPWQAPPDRKHAAPWTIGRELGRALRKRGHAVAQYDWTDRRTIAPSPGDVLIGHPHPENGYIFRNSIKNKWTAIYGISPWNGSDGYTCNVENVLDRVSHYFLICGEYWASQVPSRWRWKTTCLDMAIRASDFLRVKTVYSAPGQRRFLYIGCTVPEKGTEYIERLIAATGYTVGHVGYGHIAGAVTHGFVDLCSENGLAVLAQYDFLLMAGQHDANPTTVLEAACWGLVPVLSPTCGWTVSDFDGFWLPSDRATFAGSEVLHDAQKCSGSYLRDAAESNRSDVADYSWERFCAPIISEIEKP